MKSEKKSVKAVILAGGYSRRMRLQTPKQLVKIDQKPVLAYTLDTFERCKLVQSIILVVHRKYTSQCRKLIKKYKYTKVEQLVIGGRTRQQSVFNALKRIKDCDYLVIHDGVRPLVSQKIVLRIIKAVKSFSAVTCAVKTVDTIVEAKNGFISFVLCRNKLMAIQTPQAFRFDLIFRAHQIARKKGIINASDDTQLLLGLKKKVKLIEGSYRNIKITTLSDLHILKELNGQNYRK